MLLHDLLVPILRNLPFHFQNLLLQSRQLNKSHSLVLLSIYSHSTNIYEASLCTKICAKTLELKKKNKTQSILRQVCSLMSLNHVHVLHIAIFSPDFSSELRTHIASTQSISIMDLILSEKHQKRTYPNPNSKPSPPTALSISTKATPFFPFRFFLESPMLSVSARLCLGTRNYNSYFNRV